MPRIVRAEPFSRELFLDGPLLGERVSGVVPAPRVEGVGPADQVALQEAARARRQPGEHADEVGAIGLE